jgi:hypothetical protein
VNAFGYVRNTVDMDVWIAYDPENQQRVLQAIRDFAFPAAPDDLLHEPDAMVRMGVQPLRIEVPKQISGVEFEDYWPLPRPRQMRPIGQSITDGGNSSRTAARTRQAGAIALLASFKRGSRQSSA